MRLLPVLVVALAGLGAGTGAAQPALQDLLDRATRYVQEYERSFTLLVADEEYLQWIERPTNPGSNLSRTNPGGGMQAGGERKRVVLKSDFVLVQLGEGMGWMPFRDVFDANGTETRHHDDRLAKLFLSNNPNAFDLATEIDNESKKRDIGQVSRNINNPTLGMALLHPRVRERFAFQHAGDEQVAGRLVERLKFRETARPTLIKTTRGRDLGLEGRLWIEPSTGVVVKTEMVAADPAVRAVVTVTFRRDAEMGLFVPAQMDEYYKATLALDEVFAKATYTNARRYEPRR